MDEGSGELTTGYHTPSLGEVFLTTPARDITSRTHDVKAGRVTTVTEFNPGPDGIGLIKKVEIQYSLDEILKRCKEWAADEVGAEAGLLQFDMTLTALEQAGLKVGRNVRDAISGLLDPASFVEAYRRWKESIPLGHGLGFLEWRRQVTTAIGAKKQEGLM